MGAENMGKMLEWRVCCKQSSVRGCVILCALCSLPSLSHCTSHGQAVEFFIGPVLGRKLECTGKLKWRKRVTLNSIQR